MKPYKLCKHKYTATELKRKTKKKLKKETVKHKSLNSLM